MARIIEFAHSALRSFAITGPHEEARRSTQDDEADEAAAAYWSRIGADLPLDERRMRGKTYAAGLPRHTLC